MALNKYTGGKGKVQALSDKPNENEGLSASELKQVFDETPDGLVDFLNDDLTENVYDKTEVDDIADNFVLGAIPDTSLTKDKLVTTLQKDIELGRDVMVDTSVVANTITIVTGGSGITGLKGSVKVANTNTGPVTINIDGTDYDLKKNITEDLEAGDAGIGEVINFAYDGTNVQLLKAFVKASIVDRFHKTTSAPDVDHRAYTINTGQGVSLIDGMVVYMEADEDSVKGDVTSDINDLTATGNKIVHGYNNSYGAFYGDSGNKVYYTDYSSNKIYQRTLSTPYDIDTAGAETSFDMSGTASTPMGGHWRSDGLFYYIFNNGDDKVRTYSVSSAWDVTTSTYEGVSTTTFSSTAGMALEPVPIGTGSAKAIFSRSDVAGRIAEYTVSYVDGVLTSGSFQTSVDVSGISGTLRGVRFNSDGSLLYGINTSQNLYEITLPTPYNADSATLNKTKNIGIAGYDVDFNPALNTFIVATGIGELLEYINVETYTEPPYGTLNIDSTGDKSFTQTIEKDKNYMLKYDLTQDKFLVVSDYGIVS